MILLLPMSERSQTRARPRTQPSRRAVLLALVLLPALLCGSLFAGVSAWIHAHGEDGTHVHLVASTHAHEVAALHDHHVDEHGDQHEDDCHEPEEPCPGGLLVELPDFLATHRDGTPAGPATGVLALGPSAVIRVCCAVATRPRPAPVPTGWPPPRHERSGIAALLLSSHALLI